MKPYIFTFIGNKEVRDRQAVLNSLLKFLGEMCFIHSVVMDYPIFYCGGYGEFSQLVSEAIDIARKRYPYFESEKLLIIPYNTPAYLETLRYAKEYYDDIVYPPLENVPEELAISRRNQWMIDQCDILVVHMWNRVGNTRKCVEYAIRKDKVIYYI